ncbi:MAG: TetR family transcriptional regulator [Rhizobiaceae bacterium]|nr:TetR family transcriptional regulator [Rhizobiaceae bacterium]
MASKTRDRGIRLGAKPAPREYRAFGRQSEPDERIRLIVDAAARSFETKGFHGTSVQDIADAVGLTKAALYYYVKTKEDLLALVHDAFVSTMLDAAEEFVSKNPDPMAQLMFFVENILVTVAEYRPYVRAFFQDLSTLRGDSYDRVVEKRSRYEHLVSECLTNGIRSGTFDPTLDPKLTTLYLFGACNWTYQWLHPEGPLSIDQLVEQWRDFTRRVVAPKR